MVEVVKDGTPLDRTFRWYKLSMLGQEYIFRGVTRAELRLAGTKKDAGDAETFLLDAVVQGEHDWNKMLAGVYKKLLDEVYRVSGLTEEGLTFKEAIDWIKSENGAIEAAAVTMVAGCDLDTLENCDPNHYARYCILGKFAFESIYGVSVEQAFMGKEGEGDPDSPFTNVSVSKGAPVAPGPGQVSQSVEQYTWRKPKAKKE